MLWRSDREDGKNKNNTVTFLNYSWENEMIYNSFRLGSLLFTSGNGAKKECSLWGCDTASSHC